MISRLILAAFFLSAPLRSEVTLQAYGEIAPSATDALGDTVGGIGSAIAYDSRTSSVFMLPDRGAGDGSIDYRPRFHRLRVTPSPSDPRLLDCRIVETVLFRDANGRPFTGLAAGSSDAPSRDGRRCLDPEAIAIAPDGSLYVSDEYTPALFQFDRSGNFLREIPLPDWVIPRDSSGRPDYKNRTASGRDDNRGAESLGILPGGKRAALIFQSALVQDGGKPAGTTRILIIDLRSGKPVAEYPYAFGPAPGPLADLSVNDLAIINKHTFLVLERDGSTGRSGPLKHPSARYKAVWIVDTRGATNLLELRGQPYALPPSDPAFKPLSRDADVNFVRKTLLFNLPDLLPQLGLNASELSAKWEGIALMPSNSRRSIRLLMAADNDFLNPTLRFDGRSVRFPRAQDAVPSQIFEILAPRP